MATNINAKEKNKKFAQQIFTKSTGLKPTPKFNSEPDSIISTQSNNDLVSEARSLYLNNGIIKSAVDKIAMYSIGRGFQVYSLCENEKLREKYTKYISDWMKIASIEGYTFHDLLYMISTAITVDGDCFVLFTESQSGFPQLQFIRANRVYGSKFDAINGIVTNDKGFEVGYIIDGETYISSKSLLHLKDVHYLSTNRGLSAISHALKEMRFIEDIHESELTAAKIASQIALVEKNEDGGTTSFNNVYSQNSNIQKPINNEPVIINDIGNGQIKYFQAGSDCSLDTLKFERPSPNYLNFETRLIKSVLAGLQVPYELVVEPNATGTGIRSSLSSFDKTCEDRTLLLQRFTQLIIEYVLAKGILNQDLVKSPRWFDIQITKPVKPSIDIGRSSTAMINEFNAGLRTLEECITESGLSTREFIEKRGQELKIIQEVEKKYNILFK